MSLPKISIIIPVYNVEPYIAECLCSVMRQTYVGPIECVLVDDCGSDKSMEIADKLIAEYKGQIEFRLLHHKKNLGLSCARNTGIDVATGDYIYFLDSDDYISDDCINLLVSFLKKGSFDVIVGNNDEFGLREKEGFGIPEEGWSLTGVQYVNLYLDGYKVPASAWNKLCRIGFLKENSIYFVPDLLLEDQYNNFLLSYYPCKVFVSNQITYHYRIRENSICVGLLNDPLINREYCLKVWQNMSDKCDAINYIDTQEHYLSFYCSRLISISRDVKIPYKDLFFQMHNVYPYKPLVIWLSGKENFRWFVTRMAWSLPAGLGYLWMQLLWGLKKKLKYVG